MDWQQLDSQQLFAELPDAALIIDADGRVLAGNRLAAQMFELPDTFAQVTVESLLTQPERARLQPLQWLRKWAERPDAPELDYVLLTAVTASGRQIQLSVRATRLDRDVYEPVYLVILRDMSRWESRLRSEREAHRLAARLLALSADGVVTTNSAFEITYVNPSAARMFGYPAAELQGQPLTKLLPRRFRTAHSDQMRRFAEESNPSRLMSDRGQIVGLTRDGEEIPIDASITRIRIRDETVFSAQLRDLRPRQGSPQDA